MKYKLTLYEMTQSQGSLSREEIEEAYDRAAREEFWIEGGPPFEPDKLITIECGSMGFKGHLSRGRINPDGSYDMELKRHSKRSGWQYVSFKLEPLPPGG